VEQGGQQCPIRGKELDSLVTELTLQHRELVTQHQISASLSRSLRGSIRSSATTFVTPRYAERRSTSRHHRVVANTDPGRVLGQANPGRGEPLLNRADSIFGNYKVGCRDAGGKDPR
jgi:hypothetical protein